MTPSPHSMIHNNTYWFAEVSLECFTGYTAESIIFVDDRSFGAQTRCSPGPSQRCIRAEAHAVLYGIVDGKYLLSFADNYVASVQPTAKAFCTVNYMLFSIKLPWPGDSEGTFCSSSQAATSPRHTVEA